jgi:acetoacetyl-CoA reductase
MSASTAQKRVAVVTGGIGGLGIEICRQLARAGRQVVAVDLPARNERIEQFLAEVAAFAGAIAFEPVDVTDFDSCRRH